MQPFPTVEQAYARVRREELRQAVMLSNPDSTHAAAMILKGVQTDSRQIPTLQLSKPGDSFDDGRNRTAQKTKITKESGCTKCGNPRHTIETCFQVHGYPEWWKELKARKQAGRGKAAMVTAEPELSLVPQDECPINSTMPCDEGKNGCVFMSSKQRQPCGWIIDSGASDHMTFDPADFVQSSQPQRHSVINANGVASPVTAAGVVAFSPVLSLTNTLLVPSLSNKLLSVGQATKDLNCVVLIYPTFCLFQDILTKEIIGRGTKRGGLYYLDDFTTGCANHTQHVFNDKEQQIWLWHRRLGHPSFSY
ncbi:gag_pre-integrs domain-containing protein, partial [Cephalotus follicularis]